MDEPHQIQCPACGFEGRVRTPPAAGSPMRCTQCKETFTYRAPVAADLAPVEPPSVYKPIPEPMTPLSPDWIEAKPLKTIEERLGKVEWWNRFLKAGCVLFGIYCIQGCGSGIWDLFRDRNGALLEKGTLCEVHDYWTCLDDRLDGLTVGFVWRGEAVYDHTKRYKVVPDGVAVEPGALVVVDSDDRRPLVKKLGPRRLALDARGVSIWYLSGANAGSVGRIARYKLSRIGGVVRDF